MKNKPIKRSPHMVELSKDHHAGLLFSWKVKEGLKRGAELPRIKMYVDYFWAHHLKVHFQEEEVLLFNRIEGDTLSQQGRNEHQAIQNRINRLNSNENAAKDEYHELAELLIKHIRFEERILFPHLEQILPSSALTSVEAYLTQQHPVPFKDNYADEFWIEKK
ncbi:hemerythrin domain-containing protein [Mucilaginibacter ginsenosidivorans]|uniref:Hemerythrin domain-containing protein n=1 Tax=Mucilaginibacter ginsenosidivorans TaxID=398053 RepID=A0A5B8UVD9_9SPHI|nr:hemerythrin domain-containing protein [Mucilaginibacter ginsenosidivorans]QEC62311.1 hemerythrin domain-containing protein [Mucilaginibacter ginsenosidivorans]